jgi:hypothetical protein
LLRSLAARIALTFMAASLAHDCFSACIMRENTRRPQQERGRTQ